jgi:hypothetical protein
MKRNPSYWWQLNLYTDCLRVLATVSLAANTTAVENPYPESFTSNKDGHKRRDAGWFSLGIRVLGDSANDIPNGVSCNTGSFLGSGHAPVTRMLWCWICILRSFAMNAKFVGGLEDQSNSIRPDFWKEALSTAVLFLRSISQPPQNRTNNFGVKSPMIWFDPMGVGQIQKRLGTNSKRRIAAR